MYRSVSKKMFTEKDLLRKIAKHKGFNLGNNIKNNFQSECYCSQNDQLHSKDTFFDTARRSRLAETYFGSPRESTMQLLSHTRQSDEANMFNTFNTINQKIAALHTIGERNWATADVTLHNLVSQSTFRFHPKYPEPIKKPPFMNAPNTTRDSLRVFSARDNRYVESSVAEANKGIRSTYLAMKAGHFASSIKAGSKSTELAALEPSKGFGVNTETFESSWVPGGKGMATVNHQSTGYNLINHAKGKKGSIGEILKENPRACHRVKGLSEFYDLARVSATKTNKEYATKLSANPKCFFRRREVCTSHSDLARTYGPLYKPFAK